MRRVGNVQAGNSIVLTLLLVLVITVIGASGWFVYQHNRTRAPHAAASPHQTTTSQPSTPVPKHTIQEGVGLSVSDTLKDWSGTKSKFQIRIADGWKLMELQNPGEITILWSNTNDLAITPGSTSQILQTDDAFTDTSPNAPLEITLGISSEGFPRVRTLALSRQHRAW